MFVLSIALISISGIAALVGVTGLAGESTSLATTVFLFCLPMAIISMVVYRRRSSTRTSPRSL